MKTNENKASHTESKQDKKQLRGIQYALPVIQEEPEPLNKFFNFRVVQADEEKLILKYTGQTFWMVIGGIALSISLLMIYNFLNLFVNFFCHLDAASGVFVLANVGFFLLGVIPITIQLLAPRKRWVFNRKTKMVTVPGKFFVKAHQMPFDQIDLSWESTTTARTGATHIQRVVMVPMESGIFKHFKSNWVFLETWAPLTEHQKDWSFYTWYMDSNRPLPPGDVFDHCREREFQQRKEKGFPLPEFFSFIPTPEANEEFQKQREQVWTDAMLGGSPYKYGKVDPLHDLFPEGSYNSREKLVYKSELSEEEKRKQLWHKVPFQHKDHFKLAPEIRYVRFVFENGEVAYSKIVSDKYLSPPTAGMSYQTEYFYDSYLVTNEYYQELWQKMKEEGTFVPERSWR